LQRQVLHLEANVGKNKAISAAEFVKNLNGNVCVKAFECLLTSENAMDIIKDFDIIVDATDNVATRYLLNDACVLLGKPLVSGG
jgi:molybdopterin/thiamine biosynthesis adenylyltransferase